MTVLDERLREVRAAIAAACVSAGRDPSSVRLLPVSKRFSAGAVRDAMAAGLTTFGENRVQELVAKSAELAGAGVTWHLIGSLQTNKVAPLLRVPGLVLVQSLDRRRLADVLQDALAAEQRRLEVLLEIHATGEASKHGVPPAQARELLDHVLRECPFLAPIGLMAMGPLDGDPVPVFQRVARLRDELEQDTGHPLPVLSMGMTGDLAEAITAGSTMVRIGTGIFGPRRE